MLSAVLARGGVDEDWGNMEVGDGAGVALRDGKQGIGDLFFDNMLPEGTELQFRSPDVEEARRLRRGEAHDVADHIARETGGGRHHERVVDADLHAGERHGFAAEVFEARVVVVSERDELVEDAGVGHEPESEARLVGLSRDETLRGGIDLVEVHRRPEGGPEFAEKGVDRNASVDEAFEVRPDFLQVEGRAVMGGGVMAEGGGEDQHPTRDAGEHGDVDGTRPPDDGGEFGGPVGHLGDLRARFVEVFFHPRGQIQRGDPAEVSRVGLVRRHLGQRGKGRRAPEKQVAAAEDRRVTGAGGVVEQGVESGLAKVIEHRRCNRQILRASGGRAGRDRKMRATSRPQDVGFAAFHALDGGSEALVAVRGNALLETGVVHGRGDARLGPMGGGGETAGQAGKDPVLVAGRRGNLSKAPSGRRRQDRSAERVEVLEVHAARGSFRAFRLR